MMLFDQVAEFVGLKRPKHHFLTHVSGMMRGDTVHRVSVWLLVMWL